MYKAPILLLLLSLILGCVDLSGWGGSDPVEKERSLQAEKLFLAGNDSVDCGVSYSTTSKTFNECVYESFYLYKPFYVSYISGYGGFMGTTERSFAFNGIDLFILTSVSAACGLNNDVDCSRVYSVEECLYPSPIDTEEHGHISTFPFRCDEIVKYNGST